MEEVFEVGVSPFVRKTNQKVEDPKTDEIISWSPSQESFIIWDELQFSKTLLPKYFNHNNFSNFYNQLIRYGFPYDPGIFELANKWFQRGKKHLLKYIKRPRNRNPQKLQQKRATRPWLDHQQFGTKNRIKKSMVKSELRGKYGCY
ncbi:hypothetical protein RHGRI_001754 [Rhododendron griersonianum]|uniref:HSF-type DNA-binding domain-containing protein n=1 Tax=Rhododendron griersonianum TaxID=479676 RepID=A0AAV6LNJ6_9ERIC|nr:hypothetical protein RHGRI_001754 [Rhododendron griersonianum]